MRKRDLLEHQSRENDHEEHGSRLFGIVALIESAQGREHVCHLYSKISEAITQNLYQLTQSSMPFRSKKTRQVSDILWTGLTYQVVSNS